MSAKPVVFQTTFEPDEGHYSAEGPFNMLVSGETRDELAEAVADTLRFLWREYVDADPAIFTKDAKALRHELLETFPPSP